ncbi:hypothetical protein K440DRAFT_674447 [Wilcoxina mikolae CBS 423.85]|nr:hypothetical protein K440DRAFT_674447 [Wilcoxina mikolae CBS 423.85]
MDLTNDGCDDATRREFKPVQEPDREPAAPSLVPEIKLGALALAGVEWRLHRSIFNYTLGEKEKQARKLRRRAKIEAEKKEAEKKEAKRLIEFIARASGSIVRDTDLQTSPDSVLPTMYIMGHWQHNEELRISQPPHHRQTGVRGSLNGVNTDIFADSGSASNIITESFASEHGISIEKSEQCRRKIRFSNGKVFRVIGKATASWKFVDDPVPHNVTFDVVSKCIHRVLFGNPFLQKTQSLTKRFAHRLVEMSNRLGKNILSISNIGTIHQRLPVIAHGKLQSMRMEALPDTGAEGNIISEECFRRSGLNLEPTDTEFMFPDGTVQPSLGRVRMELSFEDNPAERSYAYFEVMRGCQHDMILGHDFVFENDVYEDDMSRLVDAAAEMGINLVIFIKAKQGMWDHRYCGQQLLMVIDPERLEEQKRRLEVSKRHQEIACAERARRFAAAEVNGTPNLMVVSVLPIPNGVGTPDAVTTGGQSRTTLPLSPHGNAPTFPRTHGGRWRRFRELLRRVATV